MSGFFVLTFMVSIYLTTRSSIVPYIIEVDQFGATKNIGKIDQIKYTPNDAEVVTLSDNLFLTLEILQKTCFHMEKFIW